MQKSQLTGKDCDAWKDCRKKKGQQGMRWLDSITHSVDLNLNKLPEIAKEREAWHASVHGVTKSQITSILGALPSLWLSSHNHT